MTLTLEIPGILPPSLGGAQAELGRRIVEGFAVESYRSGELSCKKVGDLLGHASRWQTEDFLSAHDAWPSTTEEEIKDDLAILPSFRAS